MKQYGKAIILASLILTATLALSRTMPLGPASQGNQPQQGQQAQQPAQQPPAPPTAGQPQTEPPRPRIQANDQAEADAWTALSKEQDPAKRVVAINEFLEKFPQAGLKAHAYASLSVLHLSLGDADKAVAFGEKAVELDPDRPDVLAILSQLYARRSRQGELDNRAKMQKAETYAKHALELIETLSKPSGMDDDQFVRQKETIAIMAHSGLGLTYFNSRRYALAVGELKVATEPKYAQVDPVDFYVLGLTYLNTQKYAEAVTALQRAYDETQGPFKDAVNQQLANAKRLAANPPTPAPPKP